jgi:hypothetical protein
MEKAIQKFLEFEGKSILFLDVNGVYWISIYSICQILNLDHSAQVKRIKRDPILGSEWSKQTIQVPSDQPRSLVCLPEKFIYGWLFSIQSGNPDLLTYKWKVYQLLYDYFQGTITGRKFLLEGKTKKQLRREHIESQLLSDDRFREYISLGIEINQDSKKLRDLDRQIITGQLDLWKHEM